MLNNKYAIISVMGPHAGESENEIFERKILDMISNYMRVNIILL